jgi:hypothetical protein
MATVKKLNSSYTIDTTDVYLTGNLHVKGVYDTTTVTNTNVEDRDITLNAGETAAGVGGASPVDAHLYIDRGTLGNAAIRWNETSDSWEISSNIDVGYSALTGGGISEVVQDTSPQLGGNLETNSFNIQFNAPTYLPTGVTGKVNLYSGSVSGGQSGLYVVNEVVANQELITKTRAFGLSLIL